jgi:hypothetical protein
MELRQALSNLQSGVERHLRGRPGADRPGARRGAPPAATFAAQPQRAAGRPGAGARRPRRRPAHARGGQRRLSQQAAAQAAPRRPRRQRRAQQEQPRRRGRPQHVRASFNLAEVAGGAIDDAQERWLIQKDRLDFGPFSLAQIRAQIQRGEIIGEHMIVDSDTGARRR